MEKPENRSAFTTQEIGLLIACAIVSLWLLAFWMGYDVGTDVARDYFGTQD